MLAPAGAGEKIGPRSAFETEPLGATQMPAS